jgi:hypothetical protein
LLEELASTKRELAKYEQAAKVDASALACLRQQTKQALAAAASARSGSPYTSARPPRQMCPSDLPTSAPPDAAWLLARPGFAWDLAPAVASHRS